MRAFAVALLVAVAAPSCGNGSSPNEDRLIAPADPDFGDLESPEQRGECSFDDECQVSCVWSCIPVNQGPMTCPDPPTQEPSRLSGADCRCPDRVCAYFP